MKTPTRASRASGLSRRAFVAGGLATSGLLLRSLATGLPPLLIARGARAQVPEVLPQTLILATSSAGDPVNCNCPGSYIVGAAHPEAFDPVDFDLGGSMVRGAPPWSTLDPALRQRLAFVHHATRSPAHSEYRSAMSLHGAARATVGNGADMLASTLASLTHDARAGTAAATLQAEPLPLCDETLTARGRPLQSVRPSDLAALFAPPDDEIARLQQLRGLRAATIDALYADLRANGTGTQRRFVDRYLRSAEQARALGEGLGAQLAALAVEPDAIDGAGHQLAAASILAAARVAPVVTVRVPFGGDNHQDTGLVVEAEQTTTGVAAIGALWVQLRAAGIEDDVAFALLNVFGRTLRTNARGGRNHNRDHAVMVAFGARIRGGVYGGVELGETRARCLPLIAADGAMIAPDQTLEAVGASLTVALGHRPEVAGERVRGGQLIGGLVG